MWLCLYGVLVRKKCHCVIRNEEKRKKTKASGAIVSLRHCVWSHLVIFLSRPPHCAAGHNACAQLWHNFLRMCDSQMDKCHVFESIKTMYSIFTSNCGDSWRGHCKIAHFIFEHLSGPCHKKWLCNRYVYFTFAHVVQSNFKWDFSDGLPYPAHWVNINPK